MQINTAQFGRIQIDESTLLHFPSGILGFEDQHRFAMITCEQTAPFTWLQSIDIPTLALPMISPFIVKPDYVVEVEDKELACIQADSEEDVAVMCVSVLTEDVKKLTVNLLAPVLVNCKRNLGAQIVMGSSDDNLIRFAAFSALMEYYRKAEQNAGIESKA